MKKLKKVLCLILAYALVIPCLKPNAVLAKGYTKNGFTFDSDYYSVSWERGQSYNVYSSVGGKLGTLTYTVGRARYHNSKYDDTLLVRMVMTPNKSKVRINNEQYGYGLSEYVSVKSRLPGTIGDYRPTNKPSSNSVNLSLGFGKGGASIGASYTISRKDLDITAKCNTPSNTYYIVYDYKPNIANPLANNKYLTNESSQYGMAQFETRRKTYTATLCFDARFGAATNKAASPWLVYMNYVRGGVRTVNFKF